MKRLLLLVCCLLPSVGCDGSARSSARSIDLDARQRAFRTSALKNAAGSGQPERESTSILLKPNELQRFLRILAGVVDSGIDHHVLGNVRDMVRRLSEGESNSITFPIVLDEEKMDLEVEVFMDEADTIEVYFFSLPTLISLVDEQTTEFSEAINRPNFEVDAL